MLDVLELEIAIARIKQTCDPDSLQFLDLDLMDRLFQQVPELEKLVAQMKPDKPIFADALSTGYPQPLD